MQHYDPVINLPSTYVVQLLNLKMHHFPLWVWLRLRSNSFKLNFRGRSLFIKIDSSKKCIGFYLFCTKIHLIKKTSVQIPRSNKEEKNFLEKIVLSKTAFSKVICHWRNFFLSKNRNNIQAPRCVLFRKLFGKKFWIVSWFFREVAVLEIGYDPLAWLW